MKKSALFGLLFAFAAIGCSSSIPQPYAPEEISGADRAMLAKHAVEELSYSRLTGFLSDYSHLKPSKATQLSGSFSYRSPTKKIGLYKVILLEPVIVKLKHPDAVNPEQLAEVNLLAGRLESAIREAFGDTVMTTDTPSYGVMRLRIALTDTQPNSPMLGRFRTWDENHPGFGAAAIEAELLDSMSGEQLAAEIDWRGGKMKNLVGYFNQLEEAEEALDEWANLLRDAIDESRGLHRGFGLEESPNLFN
jgi:hypothetical protein